LTRLNVPCYTWRTGEEVIPTRPRGDFSNTNWGDHQETREGQIYQLRSTSNLVDLANLLKKKQWEKILSKAWAASSSTPSEDVGDVAQVIDDVPGVMELDGMKICRMMARKGTSFGEHQ
jgi:hypothetical protein